MVLERVCLFVSLRLFLEYSSRFSFADDSSSESNIFVSYTLNHLQGLLHYLCLERY
jgi:hypothetical protein